jgi:hypothetical protein
MPEPIPEAWRSAVIGILRTEDRRLIVWTTPARQRWEADTFGDAQLFDAYDAMIAALERDDVTGNETTSNPGQVGTYEFMFTFRNRPMYGKVALYENRLQVLILSAHKPKQPTL